MAEVNQAIESAETHQKAITKHENEQDGLQKARDKEQQKYLVFNEKRQQVQQQMATLQGNQQSLQAELSADLIRQYAPYSVKRY